MCATCGCGPDHHHKDEKKVLDVEQDILQENNLLAQRNRGYFDGKNIFALNLRRGNTHIK